MVEPWLLQLVLAYGTWAVFTCVMLDGIGLPVPSESVLAAAAMIAARDGNGPALIWIVAAATAGAIIGDNIGYCIGRHFAANLMARFGPRMGLTVPRQRLGRYLFARYGAGVVFVARFVPFLRTCVSILAGMSHMRWRSFLLPNVMGAATWSVGVAAAASVFGRDVRHMPWPLWIAIAAIFALAAAAFPFAVRRTENTLQAEADAAQLRDVKAVDHNNAPIR